MAEISFGGLATGLPTEDIVSSLMAVERAPIDRLAAQKEAETTRLKAYGELRDLLVELRSSVGNLNLTSEVRTSTVEMAADAPFSATSNGAETASYDVAVAQLAQVQKSVGQAVSSQDDALFGSGTLTLGDQEITIDESNNSLKGLMSAINKVADETGVRASIINDGDSESPYRLVLTGDDATTEFTPVFDLQDSEGNAIAFDFDQIRSAQQAVAYVDGIKVVSDSNTLTGVISGVSLTLHEVSEQSYAGTSEDGVAPDQWADPPTYQATNMNVTADTGALKEKIADFVDSYNGVMNWISSGYVEFGATTSSEPDSEDEDATNLSEVLRGDATVNSVKRQLQSLLGGAVGVSGPLQTLGQLGISTNRDGSISLNDATLDEQLETNFASFTNLLAGDDDTEGVMKKFNSALLQLTSSASGIYANKQDRYERSVGRIDDNISRMELLMDKKELAIRAQFNAMELLVSEMNSQSSFLTQQMESLTNMLTKD